MKNIKKKIWALMSAAVTTSALVVSMTGSSVTTVRDPDGDGRILTSDGSFILQYLAGHFNPTSQRSLDFDGNGIISNKDATALSYYWMQLINGGNVDDSDFPAPVGADSQDVVTTRTYRRHYFSSNDASSYSQYSLTVDGYDNTVPPSSTPRHIIGNNDMVRDYDTAVVNLSIGGSGFIVDDHVIATAAHCVYDNEKKEFINSDVIVVDANNNKITFHPKYADVCSTFTLENGYTFNAEKNDYALLYVEEDLSEYGALKLGVALDEYIENNGEVIVSGFPQEYPHNYQGQPYGIRFKAKGTLFSDSNDERIRYNADMSGGDSGGPVYVEEGFRTDNDQQFDYKTVVAINVAQNIVEDENQMRNIGVKITPDLLKFYNSNPNIDY